MKRQIKFRGRRMGDEWVCGYLVIDPQGRNKIYLKPFDEATSNTYYFVIPETVGQFTGLHDKNSKEIYEGDIVKNYNLSTITQPDDDLLYLVEWQEGEYKEKESGAWWLYNKPGFIFKKIHKGMSLIFSQSQIEVIGNIYENPELLKP
jgi:uncharacterized phage protein (TIGR01671 family)